MSSTIPASPTRRPPRWLDTPRPDPPSPKAEPRTDRPSTTTARATPPPTPSRLDRRLMVGLTLVAWAAIVAVGRLWGIILQNEGKQIVLFTPPVLGGYRPSLPDRYWLAVAVAAALVGVLPTLAARLSWRRLLAASVAGSALWWAVLAQVDGFDGFTNGLEWQREWSPQLAIASAHPGRFLRTFVDQLPSYSVQVRGHPPGLILALSALDRIGLAGPGWVATIVFLAGLSAIIAVAASARLIVGEASARRMLPYLVLAPSAMWLVTSFDTLFAAVAAWLIYLLLASMKTRGRRSTVLAVAAGVLAAVAVLLSYGLVLVGFVPLFAAVHLRHWRPLIVAAGTAAGLVLALLPLGYSWFAGLTATRHAYDTLALDRPYDYFAVNNLAAWGLAIGPAVTVGFVLLRDRRAWVLAGGALAAITAANLSGLSEGEVERIWLPFTLWAFVATASLSDRGWASRGFLALQAASALALTAVIATYW
jgi:hypothetical protein